MTSYQAGGGTLQASGTGSVLTLPHLAVLTDTAAGDSGSVKALSGGEVNLPDLDAVTAGSSSTVGLLADGAGSLLNLPALVGIGGPSSLTATHHGAIAAPLLTVLAGTALTLDGTGTLPTAQLISFERGADQPRRRLQLQRPDRHRRHRPSSSAAGRPSHCPA